MCIFPLKHSGLISGVTVLISVNHEALVFKWINCAEINVKYKSTPPISSSVIARIPVTYKMHPAVKHTATVHQVLSH